MIRPIHLLVQSCTAALPGAEMRRTVSESLGILFGKQAVIVLERASSEARERDIAERALSGRLAMLAMNHTSALDVLRMHAGRMRVIADSINPTATPRRVVA